MFLRWGQPTRERPRAACLSFCSGGWAAVYLWMMHVALSGVDGRGVTFESGSFGLELSKGWHGGGVRTAREGRLYFIA